MRVPLFTAFLAGSLVAGGQLSESARATPRLTARVQLHAIFNGVTTTSSGRIFVPLQRQDPTAGLELAEIVDGVPRAYPDAAWNAWTPGKAAGDAFVGVNAIRIGPEGDLWVVDKGAKAHGEAVEPGGPKLVQIDLANDRVRRVYSLGAMAKGHAFVDDVRFNGRHAYLTDAGSPAGIIVLDLVSGESRRVLDDDPSARQRRTLTGEHHPLVDKDGKPVVIQADQLEVSPDGRWLYYQPCTGPMSRIETRWLDDPQAPARALALHVQPFADTHSTAGTAMDAAGNIYASDTDALSILKITPGGKVSTVIRDPRLIWADAMWIDDDGRLWIPAAQLDRTAGMHHGVDAVHYPTVIYTLPLGVKPLRR
jgi:sugar lactone lactonase YvrE